MTTHPNSLDLEAFACGDEIAAVGGHLASCEACRAFVESLRGLPVPKIDLPATPVSTPRIPRIGPRTLAAVALPLAAAAVLVLFFRQPKPQSLAMSEPVTTAPTAAATEPATSFKGQRQVAVIRERGGEQKRFTGRVPVKEGDRLRVEVAIDREQTILAGVLGEDGSYLELMPSAVRPAGTHYSEKSARVSGPPSGGTILVGTEEQIARAKHHQPTADLDEVRVEWEPSR
jgi:hypothetical protein